MTFFLRRAPFDDLPAAQITRQSRRTLTNA
jgi:hypothetical protein